MKTTLSGCDAGCETDNAPTQSVTLVLTATFSSLVV